jgi:hypothetical protein
MPVIIVIIMMTTTTSVFLVYFNIPFHFGATNQAKATEVILSLFSSQAISGHYIQSELL